MNAKDAHGKNVLHQLAKEEDTNQDRRHEVIDLLLKQKVDENAQDELG
jgi:hypothetical protein